MPKAGIRWWSPAQFTNDPRCTCGACQRGKLVHASTCPLFPILRVVLVYARTGGFDHRRADIFHFWHLGMPRRGDDA